MQDLVSKALDLSRELSDQKINLKTIKLTQASNYNPQAFFNLVKKPTNEKTSEDMIEILGVMVHEFVSVAESLPGLDAEEMILYALSLQAKSLMPFDILCRIGESPIEVYYVLSGNIGVTNLNNKVLTQELIEGKIFHTEVRGATLGEASILFNSNRTATLLATGETLILTMKKEPFMKTVGEIQRKVNISRIEMIQKISPFINWSSAQLASLFKLFIKVVPKYHGLIYKQDSRDDFLYIILKGEIELLVDEKPEPQIKSKDSKLALNNRVPKKLPKVIQRLSIGSYFGDEEGNDFDIKSCSARANDYDCLLLKISKLKIKQNMMYESELQQDYQKAAKYKLHHFKNKVEHLRVLSENMDNILSDPKLNKKILDRPPLPKQLPPLSNLSKLVYTSTQVQSGGQMLDDFKDKGILHHTDSETIAQKMKKSNVEISGVISPGEQGESTDSKIDKFQRDFADSMLSEKQRQRLQRKAEFAEMLLQKQSKISSARSYQAESFMMSTHEDDEIKRADISISTSVLEKNAFKNPKLRFLKRALQVSKSAINLHMDSDPSSRQKSERIEYLVHDQNSSILLPSIKKDSNSKKYLKINSERFNSQEPIKGGASLFKRNHKKITADAYLEGAQRIPILSAGSLHNKIGVIHFTPGSKESAEGKGSARAIDLDELISKNMIAGMHISGSAYIRATELGSKDCKAHSFRSIPTEKNDSHIDNGVTSRKVTEKIVNSLLVGQPAPIVSKDIYKTMLAPPPKVVSRRPVLIKQASAQDVLISRQ